MMSDASPFTLAANLTASAGPRGRTAAALTLARMLVAARLWPDGADGVMGFRDDREVTKQDWLAILDRLSTWRHADEGLRGTDVVPLASPFTEPAEELPATPGALETLRQQVLAVAGGRGERGAAHTVPLWVLHRVTSLVQQGSYTSVHPDVWTLIAEATAPTPEEHVYCAYAGTADIALHIAAIRRARVLLGICRKFCVGPR